MNYKKWTQSELDYLKTNYPLVGTKCADYLKRCPATVKSKASSLKIHFHTPASREGFKICCLCHQEKLLENFYVRNQNSSQRASICKKCSNSKSKVYRKENAFKLKENQKRYNKEHKQQIAARHREYNPSYYQKNKDRIRIRNLKRRQDNPIYRMTVNLRSRVRNAIMLGYKKTSAVKLLGCSIPEFKLYLESKFKPGMTWENYGEWHIDHILPCASFDLTQPSQQRECFHYSNLQPLWAEENLSKGDRILQT